ncbi:hypothetical protein N9O69_04950 [Alphaproteobacteria bacterium]|nr:hypothetical protein [Alphaproteobacteria bacterium]
MKYCICLFLSFIYCKSLFASPGKNEFFNSLYSQAFFLEQCISRNKIKNTNIHNNTMNKARSLGYSIDNFWDAGKKGAKGYVFDMIKNNWIKVSFTQVNCKFVQREQTKFFKTLSRY